MIIGIIGEAGTGKTTAINFFQNRGTYIISADKVVKHIYSLPETKQVLINEFGSYFLTSDKFINMKKLRQEAFQNISILRKLEAIIWPKMVSIIKEDINHNITKQAFIVIDCAVLFNAKLNSLVDKIILVEADEDKKIQRIKMRDNVDEIEIISLLKQQKKYLILNKDIDFVVKNNSTINDFIKQLQNIQKQLI